MPQTQFFVIFFGVMCFAACSNSSSLSSGESKNKSVSATSNDDGSQSATVTANSDESQTVTADENSDLKDVSIEIPPSSLDDGSGETEVKIQQGSTIANDVSGSYLTGGMTVTPVSVSIFVTIGPDNVAFKNPFKLTLPITPEQKLLVTTDINRLAVFYSGKSGSGFVTGATPGSLITVKDNSLVVSISRPGVYQAGLTSVNFLEAKEVASAPRPLLANSPVAAPEPVGKFFESSLALNGSSFTADISPDTMPTAPDLDSNFSYSFFARSEALAKPTFGDYTFIFTNTAAFRCGQHWNLNIIYCDMVSAKDNSSSGNVQTKGKVGASRDHIAIVKSGVNLIMFINGKFEALNTINPNFEKIHVPLPFQVGHVNRTSAWKGIIDTLKFWNVALTDLQVVAESMVPTPD